MAKDKLKTIQQTAEKLLELLGVEVKVEVTQKEDSINVQLETQDPGVLIGYHGETLSAFQLILNVMAGKQTGEWKKIVVNVGDYRQKREEVLKRMALSAAQKAHFSGEPVSLTDLSPFERRIVHLVLSDNLDVETFSEGTGKERHLVVKPRKK